MAFFWRDLAIFDSPCLLHSWTFPGRPLCQVMIFPPPQLFLHVQQWEEVKVCFEYKQVREGVQVTSLLHADDCLMWPGTEPFHSSERGETLPVQLSPPYSWHTWQIFDDCGGRRHSQEAKKLGSDTARHHQVKNWISYWHREDRSWSHRHVEGQAKDLPLWRGQKGLLQDITTVISAQGNLLIAC